MSKKILIAGVLFLVFVAVLAGGAFFEQKKKKQQAEQIQIQREKEQQAEEIEQEEKIKPKQAQEEELDTSDWQVYRSEEFDFEFKYPQSWIIERDDSKIIIHSVATRENLPEGGGAIIISGTNNDLQEFILEYEASDPPHSKIVRQEEVVISNLLITKLTGRTAIGIDRSIIFVPGKENNCTVSYHDFDSYHLKIISTFKFID